MEDILSADNEIAVVRFPDGTFRAAMIQGCPSPGEQEIFLRDYYPQFSQHVFTYESALAWAEAQVEATFVEYGTSLWTAEHNFEAYQPKEGRRWTLALLDETGEAYPVIKGISGCYSLQRRLQFDGYSTPIDDVFSLICQILKDIGGTDFS